MKAITDTINRINRNYGKDEVTNVVKLDEKTFAVCLKRKVGTSYWKFATLTPREGLRPEIMFLGIELVVKEEDEE